MVREPLVVVVEQGDPLGALGRPQAVVAGR
jgi:hypothetical protein